ncbi:MAG: hypothetical protein K6B70_07045 [Clostridia bacterium]|nr:hypothetical protein [Clostridia bacterium]
MKKFKSVMIATLSGVMLFSSFAFFGSTVNADTERKEEKYLKLYPRNVYEVNASEILIDYAHTQTGNTTYLRYRADVTNDLIPIYSYKADGTLLNTNISTDKWHDGHMDAVDSSNMLSLGQHVQDVTEPRTPATATENWMEPADDLIYSLARKLNISKDDITLNVKVTMQKYAGINDTEQSFTISSKTGVTTENLAKSTEFSLIEKRIYSQLANITITTGADLEELNPGVVQSVLSATLTTKEGAEYKMVIGKDNNFYLTQTKDATKESTFKTTLDYASDEKGKMDGDTYLPPYYANEEKNAKKDLDAKAIITSTTKEAIVKTNGVALTEDGKANSEGWFYVDKTDKTVIAKVYPFEKYDNTQYNGAVKETVKLVGAEGGEDTQKPSIRWTFRLINKDTKQNTDGSVTVTLTYNLPVDKDSIPEGWSPIFDKDGKTIHAITKTIKKGEDYDKDVTVKRNGDIDEKVTTNVKQVWEKLSPTLPQTGAFTAVLAVIIALIAGFAITRYRKLHK